MRDHYLTGSTVLHSSPTLRADVVSTMGPYVSAGLRLRMTARKICPENRFSRARGELPAAFLLMLAAMGSFAFAALRVPHSSPVSA